MKLKFDAKLSATGHKGTWCFLQAPFDVPKTFGTKARVPVCGTINEVPFRSSLCPMGGGHLMCINKELQAKAKVKPGDIARFVMERDEKPRTVIIPPKLKKVLAANLEAKNIFEKLSYTHKKEYVNWINDAKKEETLARRLEKIVPMILEKKQKKS